MSALSWWDGAPVAARHEAQADQVLGVAPWCEHADTLPPSRVPGVVARIVVAYAVVMAVNMAGWP